MLESNIWVLHDMSAQAASGSAGAALSIHEHHKPKQSGTAFSGRIANRRIAAEKVFIRNLK